MPSRRDRPPSGDRRPPRKPPRRAAGPPRQPERQPDDSTERLQKVLAHAGLGSRRTCEEFILQGRVTVDGQVVRELGTKVDPVRQRVAVDGQTIRSERLVYYAVNKPKGFVSTNSDPSGRPRVIDLLPEVPERVFTVGRLDEASVGLMILTNDGELANRLAHPRYGVEKVYRAVVAGSPSPEVLDKLVEGIWLAEGKVRARRAKVVGKQGDATVLEMVLAEGKNREVRRMLARLGHKVMSLTRVRVGPITLGGMRVGEWRRLAPEEVKRLQDIAAGLPDPGPPRPEPRRPVRPSAPTRPAGPRVSQARAQGGPAPRPAGPRGARPAPAGGPGRPAGPAAERRPPRPAGPAGRRPGPPPRPPVAGARPPRPRPPVGEEPMTRRILGMPGSPPPPPGRPPKGRRRPPIRPGQRAPILKRKRRGPAAPPPDEAAE